MRFPVLIALLVLPLVGCKKPASVQTLPGAKSQASAGAGATTPTAQVQACSLITNDEVSTIQKTPITGAQSNQSSDGTYIISLCYYSSSEPNKSVSFALTESDPNHPANSDPRKYWSETFASGKETDPAEKKEAQTGRKEEEHEKGSPPKKIDGIGEQAFWAGNRFGGALYVLKEHYILRISVGGPENEETKINKSKALAEKAMGRL